MQNQVGLRKHHYEQSRWRWWNSSWAISNPKRCCCESTALSMPANLGNSAVATGLEKVSFHSSAKECSNHCTSALISHASKVMLKILQARLQQYVNCELPDVQARFRKGRRTRENCWHLLDHWKTKRVLEKHLHPPYWLCQSLWLCGSQQTVEILQEMGIADHLTWLLRNLYAGQEVTVRTGHGMTDWLLIGKGVCQGCVLSPCLFNLYAE